MILDQINLQIAKTLNKLGENHLFTVQEPIDHIVPESINKFIDHTNLNPNASENDIHKLCQEAIQYQFKSVCISPFWVTYCANLLQGHDILVCSVVDFPHGQNILDAKLNQVQNLIDKGAQEIDFVQSLPARLQNDLSYLLKEFSSIQQICLKNKVTSKVILETSYLNNEQIINSCLIARLAKLNFVKTSTGFSSAGATSEHIKLMKQIVGNNLEVKASGGIRDFDKASEMIKSGASRLGTSASINIIERKKLDAKQNY